MKKKKSIKKKVSARSLYNEFLKLEKQQLTDRRKAKIKSDWKKFTPRNKEEKKYLNKVKAGHAREKTGIKDNEGRYVPKAFTNELIKILAAKRKVSSFTDKRKEKPFDLIAREAGISKKDLKEYYGQNKKGLQKILYTTFLRDVYKNYLQLYDAVLNYKGIIKNEDETGKVTTQTKDDMLFIIDRFNQFVKSEYNVVEWSVKPKLFFSGNMVNYFPSLSELKKLMNDLQDGGEIKKAKTKKGKKKSGRAVNITLRLLIAEMLQEIHDNWYGEGTWNFYVS